MLEPTFLRDKGKNQCHHCGCPLPMWRELALHRLEGRVSQIERLLIKYEAQNKPKEKDETSL